MLRFGVVVGFLVLSAGAGYLFGASAGMYMTRGYVSLEDMKLALAKVIRKLSEIEIRLRALEEKERGGSYRTGIILKDGARVRLGVWDRAIASLRKGTKVIIFGQEKEFYITNFGYIHKSLVEVPDGK